LNKIFLIFPFLIFIACSDKASYSPEKGTLQSKRLPFYFNNILIDRIENKRAFLSDGRVIDNLGNELNISEKIGFVSTKRGDLIATVTETNSIQVLKDGDTLFSFDFDRVSSVDRRLPRPIFNGNNILYFTLDGKIAIYSIDLKKILKVVNVSYETDYGNVIDYRLKNNSLTLITHKSIMHIENGSDVKVSVDMRGAIFKDDYFFGITKSGEVRKYNYELQVLEKKKFPFAYFVTWGMVADKIYLLESNGYFIELKSDFSSYRVFREDVDLDDENCFFTPEKFICDEKVFYLPLSG
jgi:hypothetical protein